MTISFSIVIPTFNEEKDIAATLNSLLLLQGYDIEVLVVDDSTDSTPEIVMGYAEHGIRFIHPGGGGRCEARNLGIQEAIGEVVVILNADVRLPYDFLTRISKHYGNGADYVLVGSRVSNADHLFARYVGCMSDSDYNYKTDPSTIEWTEGFSCRKDVALKAGLFPTGYPVSIVAGEDGFFGIGLRKSGAYKVIDFSIIVDHVSPSSLPEFWRVRCGRGEGSAQVHRYLDKWSYRRLACVNLLKVLRTFARLILFLPSLCSCWKATRYSPQKLNDVLPFLYTWIIEQLAFHYGEWSMTLKMYRKERDYVATR